MPYVYQLLAALLESNRTGMLPAKYTGLIVLLLNPASWESRGNIPGCARLLSAVIPRAALLIESEGKIEQVLGIFQGLMNSKKTDQYGFDVLESVTVSYKGFVQHRPWRTRVCGCFNVSN